MSRAGWKRGLSGWVTTDDDTWSSVRDLDGAWYGFPGQGSPCLCDHCMSQQTVLGPFPTAEAAMEAVERAAKEME